jgi:hypothetical protein
LGKAFDSFQTYQASLVRSNRFAVQIMTSQSDNSDPFKGPTITTGMAMNYMGSSFSCHTSGRCAFNGKFQQWLQPAFEWMVLDPRVPGFQVYRGSDGVIMARVLERRRADGNGFDPIIRELSSRPANTIQPGFVKPSDLDIDFCDCPVLISNVVERNARSKVFFGPGGDIELVASMRFSMPTVDWEVLYHPSLGWAEGLCGNPTGSNAEIITDTDRQSTYVYRDGHTIEAVNAFRVTKAQSFFEPYLRDSGAWQQTEDQEKEWMLKNPNTAQLHIDPAKTAIAIQFCEQHLGLNQFTTAGKACIVDYGVGSVPKQLLEYQVRHKTNLKLSSDGEEKLQQVARLIDDMISQNERTIASRQGISSQQIASLKNSNLKLEVLKKRLMQNYVAELSDAKNMDFQITSADMNMVHQVYAELQNVRAAAAAQPQTPENQTLIQLIDYVSSHIATTVAG